MRIDTRWLQVATRPGAVYVSVFGWQPFAFLHISGWVWTNPRATWRRLREEYMRRKKARKGVR